MSHGELSSGDKASATSSRDKPDPVFVAATIAQHKAELRGRLARILGLSKRRGFSRRQHFQMGEGSSPQPKLIG
jgi:hypothetical protein